VEVLYFVERTSVSVYPSLQTAVASSNVAFQCVVRSDPHETSSLQIYWRRDGHWLVTDDLCVHRCLVTKFDGHISSLLITDVTPADSGQYVCQAISSVDVADAVASLLVKGLFLFFLHLFYYSHYHSSLSLAFSCLPLF